MEQTALLHMPETEYAFLDNRDTITIRFRCKVDDLLSVNLISGDPYQINSSNSFEITKAMKIIYSTDLFDFWEIKVKVDYRRIAYAFKVIGKDGTQKFYCDRGIYEFEERFFNDINFYFKLPYFHEVDMYKAPTWVEKTIWYQIFPERFNNGNQNNDPIGILPWDSEYSPTYHDYFGGDLQGIIDKLDYIQDLGINGIYLTPIFKANTNHKYDSEDYFEIDPDFGDKETLKKLVEEAHARNIKIMLDGVFNHIGYRSHQWQDLLKNQEKSIFKKWFHINKYPVTNYNNLSIDEVSSMQTTEYDAFAFAANMPKLNTSNQDVQNYILSVLEYWTVNFNIDGWRFDVANEVDHQFWKKVHRKLTQINSEIYLLGEAWHSARSWLQGDEFHAVMNYPFTDPIKLLFFEKEIDTYTFKNHIVNQLMLYKDPVNRVQFNLLDSHDTGRVINAAKGNYDIVKGALLLMYCLGGTPCLYYGTEVGLSGNEDPDNRKCMPWDEEYQKLDMLKFIKSINKFRSTYNSLINYSKIRFTLRNSSVLEFYKEDDEKKMEFVFNLSDKKVISDITNERIVLGNLYNTSENRLIIDPDGFVVTVQNRKEGDSFERY